MKQCTGRARGSRPPRPRRDHGRRELAARYAPLIYFDAKDLFEWIPMRIDWWLDQLEGGAA